MSTNHPQPHSDEFYTGYGPIPPGYRRFLLFLIPALINGALLLAIILPQVHFDQFHAGTSNPKIPLEGLLITEPAPHLLVPQEGTPESRPAPSVYLLSGPGKTAPSPAVLKQAGQWVKLAGVPFVRNNLTVVATRGAEPSQPPAGSPTQPPPMTSLGQFTLTGEIVDGKCYPGIMKPGRTKTHRACAVRCITGGVPPVFLVQKPTGEALYFLLADQEGKAVRDRILGLIADPIQITGEVMQYGDSLVLKADPTTYELL